MTTLCSDIIDKQDISKLSDWLLEMPRLTKGQKTLEFEANFSEFLGCKHSVFCNSGSSANLLITSALLQSNRLRNNKIVVPQISWSTTLFPSMQLGLQPILCDCNRTNLGIDIEHFKKIIKEENPAAIILVHVLGFDSNIKVISDLCKENDIILIEDTCESLGSQTDNQHLGTFGLASSFSFYFGHHISTIEGGMVCTDDDEFAEIIKMIRSHGWDRDLSENRRKVYQDHWNIKGIDSLYTFYYTGFNLRSTDLQAFLGINQIDKIPHIVKRREENYLLYNELLRDHTWIPTPTVDQNVVSNMGYPLIVKNRDIIYKSLNENNIECRPLISGSMGMQPAWIEKYGPCPSPNASVIDSRGMYVPNHQDLTLEQVNFICDTIKESL
tara:strand:+ start:543 stop:1694 length:1152 start_codon:yes stop_codon:yes gene_type:complete